MRTGSSHCGTLTIGLRPWRREDKESRPHRGLQDRTSAEFAWAVAENHLCGPLTTAGESPKRWSGIRELSSAVNDSHGG